MNRRYRMKIVADSCCDITKQEEKEYPEYKHRQPTYRRYVTAFRSPVSFVLDRQKTDESPCTESSE